MKKIRINELARDLEIKANLILDKLPDFGVTEKKTHSSSVDEDVAEKLRDFFVGSGPHHDGGHNGASSDGYGGDRDVSAPHDRMSERSASSWASSSTAVEEPRSEAESDSQSRERPDAKASAGEPAAPSDEAPNVEAERPAGRISLRPPIRPPMAGQPQQTAAPVPVPSQPAPVATQAADTTPSAPSVPSGTTASPEPAAPPAARSYAPPRPPLATPGSPSVSSSQATPQRPATTPGLATPSPAQTSPQTPSASQTPSAVPGRPAPPPARPIPTSSGPAARPGQVLTGPRAPLPPGMASSPLGTPGLARPAAPGIPRPPSPAGPRPQAGQPLRPQGAGPRPPSYAGSNPGAPRSYQPPPTGAGGSPSASPGVNPGAPRPLVGQPAPRPTVPPRPDLARRLTEQPRMAGPGAPMPAAPRPGVPQRPPQSPQPGRPIFPNQSRPGGPGRPGSQQPYARSGAPGTRAPGGRGMHPTTQRGALGGVGLVPAPAPDTTRRPTRGTVRPQNHREREEQERSLRPVRREREQGPPPINRDITISEGVTVKELSEKLDVKANKVIAKLLDRGIFATINQTLDSQLATDIAREFGASTSTITFEEDINFDIEVAEEAKDLIRRPPVVTIMGHVDHGKTSLLDSIRTSHVADREAGGITQHIGAYYIEKNGQKIVFIDTPGHEAFTRMRSRGAKVTDVVVLVVAADDGVMPQTIEAIDHARAAKVPILVAINKVDKPDAQPDRIKQQLSDRGLLAEDWGGDVVMVPVSARTRAGLDNLLEMILLVAEIQDLKANPTRPAMGSVIESQLDKGRGPVATVLVRNGTLRVGDFFICGEVFGKVRAMLNDRGEQIREAGPSMPVEVLGLQNMPDAGDEFQVVTDTAKAKQIVLYREEKTREEARSKNKPITLEQFQKQMAAGESKELNIILKADVAGSAEVLRDTLQALSTEKVRVNVLRSAVGAINEGDVLLASASGGIVIGFNVKPDRKAEATAEHEKVDIRLHSIIYNLTDEIKKSMTGLLEPVYREIPRGKAEVREVFRVSKVGYVAGCLVVEGNINRECSLRVMREGVAVHTAKVGSLKRFKDDVSEVRMGMECGITVENFSDVRQGDVLEAFVMERIAAVLGNAIQ